MHQRVVFLSAVAGVALFGVLGGVQKASSQAPGRLPRAAVSSSNPTGQTNAAVASDAAYRDRAGEGRIDTPTPAETARRGMEPDATPPEFGRPNPGRPAFQDPEFQGRADAPNEYVEQDEQQEQGPAEDGGQDGTAPEEEENLLTVNDGFFFDNYTSGSGFGVYGGEAVTSGQGRQLNLPSAAVNARNLGVPILPAQTGGAGGSDPTD